MRATLTDDGVDSDATIERRAAVECARPRAGQCGGSMGARTSRGGAAAPSPFRTWIWCRARISSLPLRVTAGIYYVESPTDGRAVFVMPWHGATLIGTTETPYHGEPDEVQPLPEEEEYLLAVARHYFPAFRHLTREDITQRFAGLRVLPAATQAAFDRSRETIFTTDRDARPRVLGIYGGKLTGWRAAAAHVLQRISPSLPAAQRRAATDQLILRRPT